MLHALMPVAQCIDVHVAKVRRMAEGLQINIYIWITNKTKLKISDNISIKTFAEIKKLCYH